MGFVFLTRMLKINEIFYSIQGESSYAGWPTVFVRTSGCHLRCHYCDTTYAYFEGKKISHDEILFTIASHKTKYVCLTGGEPLLQAESSKLMHKLCNLGYIVSLETSGSLSCKGIDSRVKKILDIKTPDSGEPNSFLIENLEHLTPLDELKFVICSERDFLWSEDFVKRKMKNRSNLILYSPSFKQVEENWLANQILLKKSSARLQLQLHKYIWPPNMRGV